MSSSILPQRDCLLRDSLLSDDTDLKGIPGVNISFCGRDENIFDQLNGLLAAQRNSCYTFHVLETNLGRRSGVGQD